MSEEIILTEEQQKVKDLMVNFLESDEEVFTLKGIAGAGKTTIIQEVLRKQSNIIAATVAHVAKSVLEQSIGDIAECVTIAKLLNLRQSIDDDGNISFKPNISFSENSQGLPIETADIILIDECSMIDDKTHNMIMRYKKIGAKIIYLGESCRV